MSSILCVLSVAESFLGEDTMVVLDTDLTWAWTEVHPRNLSSVTPVFVPAEQTVLHPAVHSRTPFFQTQPVVQPKHRLQGPALMWQAGTCAPRNVRQRQTKYSFCPVSNGHISPCPSVLVQRSREDQFPKTGGSTGETILHGNILHGGRAGWSRTWSSMGLCWAHVFEVSILVEATQQLQLLAASQPLTPTNATALWRSFRNGN